MTDTQPTDQPIREPYPGYFAQQLREREAAEERRILEMRRAEDFASVRRRLEALGQDGHRRLRELEAQEAASRAGQEALTADSAPKMSR